MDRRQQEAVAIMIDRLLIGSAICVMLVVAACSVAVANREGCVCREAERQLSAAQIMVDREWNASIKSRDDKTS
jgi:hypothetical protein